MQNVSVVIQEEPFHEPEIGDYLFSQSYMIPTPKKLLQNCNIVQLGYWGYDPFQAMLSAGIGLNRIRSNVTYRNDPYDPGQDKLGLVPAAILMQDEEAYNWRIVQFPEMAKDRDWNRTQVWSDLFEGRDKYIDAPQWARSLMGSGYTDSTLPSDGYGRIEFGYVGLDNGDALLCYVWEWYNK